MTGNTGRMRTNKRIVTMNGKCWTWVSGTMGPTIVQNAISSNGTGNVNRTKKEETGGTHIRKFMLQMVIAGCCIYIVVDSLKLFFGLIKRPDYTLADAFVRTLKEPWYQYQEFRTYYEPFGVWIADPDFNLLVVHIILLLALAFFLAQKIRRNRKA